MIIQFTLPDYPNDNFEIERSEMTGKMKLTRNGVELEQYNAPQKLDRKSR
jgi:predicted FMN-binding regulatory protein PaiB